MNATDRFKYTMGVLDSVFTCQLDLIRLIDYTDLIPTCRSHYFESLDIRILESNKNKLHTTPFTSTKDTEFGDCYFDISKTDKRLIRSTLKTYERTGTYVFLKLFKKTAEDYEFEQTRLSTNAISNDQISLISFTITLNLGNCTRCERYFVSGLVSK